VVRDAGKDVEGVVHAAESKAGGREPPERHTQPLWCAVTINISTINTLEHDLPSSSLSFPQPRSCRIFTDHLYYI